MSLRLIYGKAGSGKSQFCFNEIAEKIKQNEKIYIITPEQFSFTAEKKLMDAIDTMAVINAEVLTFNRMAYRVINEVGGATKIYLSSCGKAIMIYDILNRNKRSLKFLGKSDENVEIIDTAITEFKKHNISIKDIKEEIEKTNDMYLKAKLQDIALVFEKFENKLRNNYIDENDTLKLLAEKIEYTNEFNNSLIYIDEFSGFTNQEYEIIKKLLKVANQVNVTVCTDNLDEYTNPDMDIFYSNKITISKLINLAKENNYEIEKGIYLDEIKRFKNKELMHLEESLYTISYKKYENKVENIELFLANNQYSEIEHIAQKILKLVRDDKYRYKDISIITKNIDSYSNIAKAIFNKYNIPVFIDEKKDLSQNVVVKYILGVLDIFSKNWSYEALFQFIKTGFLDIDIDEIFKLENYCIKWGIKGNKWYKDDWNYGITDDNKEEIKRLNEIRKQVITPLLNFREKVKENKNVEEITGALYNFLIENDINKKLEEKITSLEKLGLIDIANEYNTSWNVILEILDEIVLIFKKEKITFEKYTELLKIGLKNSGLGKIPGTQDQVIIGDIDRSRSHKVKVIFIIGLNDGVFPSVNKNEGFFDDKDRNILKQHGLELAKGTLERLYEDNFNIYKAFTTAEEKVYLSYASSNSEGKSLRGSILISKIKKIFPKLEEKSDIISSSADILTKEATFDELLLQIRNLKEGKKVDSMWKEVFEYYNNDVIWKEKLSRSLLGLKYTNTPERIEKKAIERLYGKVLKTSVSKLEQYRSCPFSFYLKYGLRLSEKNTFKIQALDTGTFMHEVIDEFFKKIKEENIKPKDIEDDELKRIVKNIINEKLSLNKNYIFTSTPKFKVLTNRLIRVIIQSIKYIVEGLKNTDFEIIGNEVEFKDGAEYKPIKLELEDGNKVEITGKIDRIDLAKNGEGSYIRIIDYKSSVKNIDLNEVIAGLQIQLLTYLDATCKIEEMLPAGVLYFNLIDPIVKASKSISDEEIENEIKKRFKMQGLILADVNVVKMMDKKLEKGSSNLVPAYIDKDGNLSKSKSNVVTKEQFEILQKYIQKTIKEISKEILSGNISITPYYNAKNKKTPCEYCDYKAICGFNKGFCNNKYNYISNLDKNVILDMINEKK